jgi:hypothetical protein
MSQARETRVIPSMGTPSAVTSRFSIGVLVDRRSASMLASVASSEAVFLDWPPNSSPWSASIPKEGVEFTPYTARLSALATDRTECQHILDDLLTELRRRMTDCKRRGIRNVWKLPESTADSDSHAGG